MEVLQGGHQAGGALLGEQQARGLGEVLAEAAHGVEQAAAAKADHRRPRRHRLHRGDAEILQAGKHVGAAALQQPIHHGGVLATQQGHAWAGQGLQPLALGPIAHHQQGEAGAVEGLNHQVHPLVGHQPAEAEIGVVTGLVPAEPLHGHRWVHHLGAAAPVAADAGGREAGVGHQLVGPLAAGQIPLPQLVQLQANQGTKGTAGQGRLGQVGVHLVPGITHGGVHITDMELVGTGQHPLGHQVAAAHHQGVGAQVELLDGEGQQGQVLLHMADTPGQGLDEAGLDRAASQPAPRPPTFAIHQGMELGLPQELIQFPHHQLGPPDRAGREPFVHQGRGAREGAHGPHPKAGCQVQIRSQKLSRRCGDPPASRCWAQQDLTMPIRALLEEALVEPSIGETPCFIWHATPVGIAALWRLGQAPTPPPFDDALKEGLAVGLDLSREEREFHQLGVGLVLLFHS